MKIAGLAIGVGFVLACSGTDHTDAGSVEVLDGATFDSGHDVGTQEDVIGVDGAACFGDSQGCLDAEPVDGGQHAEECPSLNCRSTGLCHWTPGGCRPLDDSDCSNTEACNTFHYCHVVDSGYCGATSTEDCLTSKACDCASDSWCPHACYYVNGRCCTGLGDKGYCINLDGP